MTDELPAAPMPLLVKVIIVVSALPVLDMPFLMAGSDMLYTMGKLLLYFYPVFVLLCAWCAWRVWQSNATLSYILIALMWLTHGAMIVLCRPEVLGLEPVL